MEDSPNLACEVAKPLRRIFKILVILVILTLVTLYFAHPPILRELARFLFVEDPLEPASAIIVLSGSLPYRPLEAAQLYQAGWAPRVILTRASVSMRFVALKTLGLEQPEPHEISRQVLLKFGVPNEEITVVQGRINSTLSEAQQVLNELTPAEGTKWIVVTSKAHSRRARLIWQHVAQDRVKVILRSPKEDPTFHVQGWWKKNQAIEMVAHEYMGLVNCWLGFPATG